jgi:hypothetical protein
MAGGPNAAVVPCMWCQGKSNRTSEGLETDWYLCEACGQKFGLDWEESGPPEAPCWPPASD